jgi:hypothetical protein
VPKSVGLGLSSAGVAALDLLTLVGLNSAVVAIPMLTAGVVAVRSGVRHPALLAGSALCGLAVYGSVVFWAFYFLHGEGRYVGIATVVVEIAVIAAMLARGRSGAVRPLAGLAMPAVATVVFTLFVLSFGFLRGGVHAPVQAASARFLPGLPIDGAVPLILARAVESDVRPLPDPLYANWSPSDRPPLQSGIFLSTTSLLDREDSELQYSAVSSLVQSLWVIGLWAFFASARTARPLAAVTTAAVLFSGFTFLNTFYVWPKLFSAAFLLVLAAVFLTPRHCAMWSERGCSVVIGLSIGGALLAHTGAIIPVLGVALLVLAWREVPPARFIVQAVLVAALLVAPWTAYQKVVNPPGDKLLKLQVAGIPNIETRRSLLRELTDHYRQVGLRNSVGNKLNNLAEPFRGTGSVIRDTRRIVTNDAHLGRNQSLRDQAVLDLRVNQTFRLIPSLGLLVIGPILLGLAVVLLGVHRKGRWEDLRAERPLFLFLALTIVLWSLVLFGPNYTVLHQSSYLIPVLAFVLCTASCWKISPLGTVALVVLQSLAAVYLYKDVPIGTPLELFAETDDAMVGLAVGSLVATVLVLVGPAGSFRQAARA